MEKQIMSPAYPSLTTGQRNWYTWEGTLNVVSHRPYLLYLQSNLLSTKQLFHHINGPEL